ncbi:HlyD family secretion protein [Methylovirgula sp. 4M-Z18]|uniref:HlyD family secretion protein n=1 Tax=Methylovirgula sp. 4M-Z18 TaxID=2293567 RepID=UPI000E2F94B5|nr:HlyD family secretion protein [Methylovirgula sp. 4M-Z18]RFB78464.1 HlyD family secretion protein [Methylovirgula sp. 4M-Z18]
MSEELKAETVSAVTQPTVAQGQQPALTGQNAPPVGEVKTGVVLKPKRSLRRFILPVALVAAVGYGGWKGYDWFTYGRFLVSTDDAYVKTDMSVLAAKVPGYIAAVPVTNNASVKAGDVLATIDDGDYRLAVQAAKDKIDTQDATIERIGEQEKMQGAQIDAANAQLTSAQAEQVRANAFFDRAAALVETAAGSKASLDTARADKDRAVAAVTSAKAAIDTAKANLAVLQAQKVEAVKGKDELQTALDKAERDLSFTVIRAPFDGVVGNKAAQPGQYVQTGTRLMALVPLDSAYIDANFKETQLGNIKPGQKVDIAVDAYSRRTIEGTVESLSPASGSEFSLLPPENATGNFTKIVQRLPVRIHIPQDVAQEGILRPGMSVVVDVHTRDDVKPAPSLTDLLGFSRAEAATANATK